MAAYSRVDVLHDHHTASLTLFRCTGADTSLRGEERGPDRTQFVLVRQGAFVHRSRRGRTAADANQVVFLERGEPYRVEHPVVGGDECLVLWVSDADRLAWMDSWGARAETGPDSPVPWKSGLSSPALALEAHRLVADIGRGIDTDELHERVMALLWDIRPLPAPPPRPAAGHADAAETVETVKALVHRRLFDRWPLAAISAEVGTSVFALCRLFRRHAGLPLHRYRRRRRLREALRRLADGERDLTGLALDLGFSEHSHFTSAFRAEFGVPPSAFRSLVSARGRRAGRPA